MLNFSTFSCLSSCRYYASESQFALNVVLRKLQTDVRTENRIQELSSGAGFHWVCTYRTRSCIYTTEKHWYGHPALLLTPTMMTKSSIKFSASWRNSGRQMVYLLLTWHEHSLNKSPAWIRQTQHCIPSFLKICDINTYDIFTDTKKDKY